MSRAKEYLLNGIYNLEKNYGRMGSLETNQLMLNMVLNQLKSALSELTDESNEELKSLGLKEIPEE